MRGTSPTNLGLMRDLIERKIRLQAEQLYEMRGRREGHALEDWLKAESEVLKTSILAPIWHSQYHDHPASRSSGPISYDSGYEHSIEHWMELQLMVHEASNDVAAVPDAAFVNVL